MPESTSILIEFALCDNTKCGGDWEGPDWPPQQEFQLRYREEEGGI